MVEDTDEYIYGKGVPMVVKPPGAGVFDKILENVRYKGQLIARNQKLDSGVAAGFEGLVIGFLFAVIMVGLPIVLSGGI